MKLGIARIEAEMKSENRKPKTENRPARVLLGLGTGALLLAVLACAPTTVEQDYGRSVHNNIAQQVVYPRAGLDSTPPTGLSPKAAANEMERYNKTFKGEDKKALEMKLTTPSY